MDIDSRHGQLDNSIVNWLQAFLREVTEDGKHTSKRQAFWRGGGWGGGAVVVLERDITREKASK